MTKKEIYLLNKYRECCRIFMDIISIDEDTECLKHFPAHIKRMKKHIKESHKVILSEIRL